VVQSGDTLLRIANRYNTTIGAIAQLNGIVNVNLIRVGQQLRIPGTQTPAPPPPPAPQTTYTVRPGDNLYRISLRFGVPLQRLIDVNRIVNPNLIFVGQVLVIPS
jgi:peptidoglycan-N-acetylglucosamine deacetylase